ncbi:hypothetical protein [Arcobacter sp. F2176]|uniref:hypothetical protein n=1 Tax=Arcobacter sp. F2176 TaxID=2044511 RepID=UPI00100B334D|nr:hypothetical protein [Arcobacter sp. F2176]RXJ81383.1 hypothetical protein CRU95_07575 [Arcobacter sp. F2176]
MNLLKIIALVSGIFLLITTPILGVVVIVFIAFGIFLLFLAYKILTSKDKSTPEKKEKRKVNIIAGGLMLTAGGVLFIKK